MNLKSHLKWYRIAGALLLVAGWLVYDHDQISTTIGTWFMIGGVSLAFADYIGKLLNTEVMIETKSFDCHVFVISTVE